jgi:hypothetical protein
MNFNINLVSCCMFLVFVSVFFSLFFISGCTYVDTKQKDETRVVSKDLLYFDSNEDLYATTDVVGTSQNFKIYLNVENVGNSDVEIILGKNTDDGLSDFGRSILYNYNGLLYTLTNFDYTKTGHRSSIYTDSNGVEYDTLILSRNNPISFRWDVRSPNDSDFTQIENMGVFKFHLKYLAKAKTYRELNFINFKEANHLDYTDNKLVVHENNIAEPGPIVIDFKLVGGEPIKVNNEFEGEVFDVSFIFKNVGDGITSFDSGSINVIVPTNFVADYSACSDFEDKGADPLNVDNRILTFVGDSIEFYGDRGDQVIYCGFRTPDVDFINTYQFSIEANYVYITNPSELSVKTIKSGRSR